MIWRENNKIFVLDDPSTQYQFIYSGIVLLKNGIYNPATGGVIDQYNQTITITYDTPVTVMEAEFYNFDTNNGIDIASSLVSTDGRKTVRYTPASYLANGRYELYLWVIDEYGNEVKDSAIYDYYSYTSKIEEKADATGAIIFFGLFMAGGIVFLLLIRFNKISLDSFIYFKNKKIIPFIKPIIFGPMTIDVNDDRISKAEFYVNGKLKDTLTEPPYVWKWNETTFMKNSIETKVYDDEGNSASSGKMTFYIFNYPKLFK